jgi:hypothetical protein
MKINNQNLILVIITIIIISVILFSYMKIKEVSKKETKENFDNIFEQQQKAYYKGRSGDINNAIYNDAEKFYDIKEDNVGDVTLNINNSYSNTKSNIDIQVEKCKSVKTCGDLDNNSNCGLCLDSGEGMYGDKNGPIVDKCSGGWVNTSSECRKTKERKICAKVQNCTQMTGEASICGWCVEQNKAVVAKTVGGKLLPKYEEDTCGSNGLISSNNCDKVFTNSSCSKTWNVGNHSKECLSDIWNWVGCSNKGSSAPSKASKSQLQYWNERGVNSILSDMQHYKKYADSNNYNLASKYQPKCYGTTVDPCNNKFSNKPASCYQKVFTESGCLKKGTAYPTTSKNISLSAYKNQIKTMISNAHNKQLNFETRNNNYNRCYGGNLQYVENNNIELRPGLNAYVYENRSPHGVIGAPLRYEPINIDNVDFWWGGGKVFGITHDRAFVIIEGYITYPKGALTVQFRLGSDDGSYLFRDGKIAINNWGLHGFRWRNSNVITVENLTDPIQINMYEWGGGANLKLEWSINGRGWTKIPNDALSCAVVQKRISKNRPVYIGCYRDNGRRAMPHLITRRGTFNEIIELARKRRFKYVGLQYGNGFGYNHAEAWGSYDEGYKKYGGASCSRLNTGEKTGISWSNAVYKL